jgi:hypothetical protein
VARYGTLKRNIRRNIRHWGDEGEDKPSGHRVILAMVLAVFIMLTLPGVVIPITMNVAFRIPDLYKFDLGRTKALKDSGMEVSEDDTAGMIASFMRHGTDKFQIEGKVDKEHSEALFTNNDSAVMNELRLFLDDMLVIGITSLVAFATLFYLLVKWIRPHDLRRGLVGGVIIFVAIAGSVTAFITFKGPALIVWEDIIGAKFVRGDKLPQLFGDSFLLTGWIGVTVISSVIILLVFSFTNRFTRRHKVF